jgi:hypothetical protein
MVGPFVFLDQMGPAEFAPGADSVNVRPHPHIGLSTLTYLFEGEIMHRDNLGFTQAIRPGEVNWMTAGKGIVHSERTDPLKKSQGGPMHGMQAWIALPDEAEETDPAFFHHGEADLPAYENGGLFARLAAGEAYGARDSKRLARAMRLTTEFALVSGAAISLLYLFGGGWVIETFIRDPEARAATLAYLPYCAAVPLLGIAAWQLDGLFLGTTQGRALRNAGIISAGLYLGADLLLRPAWGNTGVCVAFLMM